MGEEASVVGRFLLLSSNAVVVEEEGADKVDGGEGVWGLGAREATSVAPAEDGGSEGEVGDESWRRRRNWRGRGEEGFGEESEVEAGLDDVALEGEAGREDDGIRHEGGGNGAEEFRGRRRRFLLLLLRSSGGSTASASYTTSAAACGRRTLVVEGELPLAASHDWILLGVRKEA